MKLILSDPADDRVDPVLAAWCNGLVIDMFEAYLHLRTEDKHMGRSTEVEHADLLAFDHRVTVVDTERTSRHFGHANPDEAYRADGLDCLNEDQSASGRNGKPGLGTNEGTVGIARFEVVVALRGSFVRQHNIVRAFHSIGFLNPTVDRAAPAMVVLRTKEP